MSCKDVKRENFIQGLKFFCFSVSAGVIQTIVYTIVYELLNFSEWFSYLIGLICSVLYNFTLNRKFTFKSASNVPVAMIKVACYYAVFTPLSTWWTDVFAGLGVNAYVVLFATMATNLVTEFLYCKFVVFRDVLSKKTEGDVENIQEK